MMKKGYVLLLLFFSLSASAQRIISFKVDKLPAEPRGYDLFLAGSFNGWRPADKAWQFQRMENGRFFLDAKLPDGNYEYKITRGSWKETECNTDGSSRENRNLKVEADQTIVLDIAQWSDNFYPIVKKKNSASKHVIIADTAFVIPQLNRKRRLWIYLPENYSTSKKERYPVLYMHDGQNLFDAATAYAGEWGVDEFLDSSILKSCIVVGIDNGDATRMNEYNPYNTKQFGRGQGDAYIKFIVKTLKPYIDKKYRTKKDKPNTFIAGSSMGGLISFYAALSYPKVFGGIGVFSPSFWIAPDMFKKAEEVGKKIKANIYFFAGKLEGEEMVTDVLKMYNVLAKVSKAKMQVVIRDQGKHTEATWRSEFPLFYEWIMQ